jgi:hypothetical protein
MLIGLNISIGAFLAITEKNKIKAMGIKILKINDKGSRIISF